MKKIFKLTLDCPVLTTEAADLLIQAARTEAQALSLPVCICILDPMGRLKAFSAMDGAPAVSFEAAIKKAKTAVGFGIPTGKSWYQFIKDDPILAQGAQHLPDFILLGGGSPVRLNGQLVGAIGISGGHYEQDEKCVAAALSAFEKATLAETP